MGILIGMIVGVMAYRCITLFVAAGKCNTPEGCCKTTRWLYLLPIAIIILLGIGFIFFAPALMPWHFSHSGPGMGRYCW